MTLCVELEEILTLPRAISLDVLDNTLRMVISLFSSSHGEHSFHSNPCLILAIVKYAYPIYSLPDSVIPHNPPHEPPLYHYPYHYHYYHPNRALTDKYMQSPGESSHAYYLLLKSDLFRYHSERMINLILAEAEEVSLSFPLCKSYTPFFSSLISACRELALPGNIELILRT
jgi:hypothetical protein